ncbi:MAG: hypothetical protein K2L51_00920 [Clostridiales bacterium]|nr:hypothetical protein [Clostridiales bacterium]
MGYTSDRDFTDYVHEHLAVDLIYRPLNWVPGNVGAATQRNVDIANGVDYFLIDTERTEIVTTQERFRESKFAPYTDFTIRYERPYNMHEERRLSEYYKLDAQYFVYGVVNASKANKEQATDFIKYALMDIPKLKRLIDMRKIVVDENVRYTCRRVGDTIHCPITENYDHSSTFVPVDIQMLLDLYPDTVLVQRGYNA